MKIELSDWQVRAVYAAVNAQLPSHQAKTQRPDCTLEDAEAAYQWWELAEKLERMVRVCDIDLYWPTKWEEER